MARDGRAIYMKDSSRTEVAAAREISMVASEHRDFRGFTRAHFDETDARWRKMVLERSRLLSYQDEYVADGSSVLVNGAIKALANDATAQQPQIRCNDKRALGEVERQLAQAHYWDLRPQLMHLFNLLGDQFNFCDWDYSPVRKWNTAELRSIRPAPAYTMFRLDNERGFFDDPNRAFMQIPSVELFGFHGQAEQGSLLWKGDHFHAGGFGGSLYESHRQFYGRERRLFFAAHEVVHARLNPYLKPVPDGYGTPIRRSGKRITDICTFSIDDAAVARKLATFNRLHHNLKTASKEEWEAYRNSVEETEPNPYQQLVTRGEVDITAVDAQNHQLQNIDDLQLHIDLHELSLGYPLAILGFRANRVTGEVLDRLEQRLVATIRAQNDLEEWFILRPLVWRILHFAGKGDVEFDIIWPRGPRLGDLNKFAKRLYTETGMSALSRKRQMMLLHDWDEQTWQANMAEIIEEQKKLGLVPKPQGAPESSSKGKKGVEKDAPENQDISDSEGITDEE